MRNASLETSSARCGGGQRVLSSADGPGRSSSGDGRGWLMAEEGEPPQCAPIFVPWGARTDEGRQGSVGRFGGGHTGSSIPGGRLMSTRCDLRDDIVRH